MNCADVVIRGKPIIQQLLKEQNLPSSALIVTGGGSQGIRTGGMLVGFEALGLSNAFKAAYGVSCGAANTAYFLSGQATLGASVYYQDLIDGRYASLLRWPIVDINYLVYEVIGDKKRLAAERIKWSPVNFRVVVTNNLGHPVFLQAGKDMSVFDALRLAMAIPFWAGGAYLWEDNKYYDGMMVEPLPFRRAIADGYTNLLVLLNMPIQWEDGEDGFLLRVAKWGWARKENEKLRDAYFRRQERYREQLRDLLEGKIESRVNISVIAPSCCCSPVDFYDRRALRLRRVAEEGLRIAEEVCGEKIHTRLL